VSTKTPAVVNIVRRYPREWRVGFMRFVADVDGVWSTELGSVSMRIAWPPTVDPCGTSRRWWWGFGRSSSREQA